MTDASLLCHRCGVELSPGKGDWYVVRIEAFADPSPPDLDKLPDDREAMEREYRRLIEAASEQSPRELMDQVHRRLTIHLCGPCYARWIERPAG